MKKFSCDHSVYIFAENVLTKNHYSHCGGTTGGANKFNTVWSFKEKI